MCHTLLLWSFLTPVENTLDDSVVARYGGADESGEKKSIIKTFIFKFQTDSVIIVLRMRESIIHLRMIPLSLVQRWVV